MEVGRENECPESGEFFFHGKLRQKISLNARKGAQNWPSQHVNSHFLIDQPRTSALGAAVELLFCLPPVWESSSSHLGFQLNCISQLDFFHICFIFVFLRSGCLRLSSESATGHFPLCVIAEPHIMMWESVFFFRLCSQKIAYVNALFWQCHCPKSHRCTWTIIQVPQSPSFGEVC